MRILLTGATGFTGAHFTTHAMKAGHEIVPFEANLTNATAVKQLVSDIGAVDAVVHLAAISFVGHDNVAEFYGVNTVGTTHLLSALANLPEKSRPSKVLIASSANVYGNCEYSPIVETQAPAPTNHYSASKLAMEHMAMTFLDRLPIVITRPFNYTGPGQAKSFLIPKLVDHFVRKAPVIELGNLHVEREFNDVRVVTDAYLRLLFKGVNGEIYNVCSGKTYSLMDVIKALTKLTDHSIEVKVNPAFVRANEVHQLCGDSAKLVACIDELQQIHLDACLSTLMQRNGMI